MAMDTVDAEDAPVGGLFGSPVRRREDAPLISGDAEYTDDIQYPRMGHLAVLRSQYAHATIEAIDTNAAAAMDGVRAVYTAADVDDSAVPGTLRVDDPDDGVAPEHPILASERVRFQGQPVAAVVADDRYRARDAAAAIDVTYDRRDAVVDPDDALADAAPVVHDEAPDNVAFRWEAGNPEETEAAFADADHVVSFDMEINRVLPTAMEPRGAVARYRASTGELAVELSTQNPHQVQEDIAIALGLPDHKIRVRPPDVGGGFGAKLQPYSGYLLAAWCAMQTGRPMKWTAGRTEDCQSMVHSRHHIIESEAALSADGQIRGIRASTRAPVGAFLVPGGSGVPTNLGVMANGQYAVPAVHVETTGIFTHTTPLSAYRGAGRPEATHFIERLVEVAARELDMDSVELRRRNFIDPDAFPYETPVGRTYDSGDYEKTLATALEAVDYDSLRERQERLREEGRYLGIGLSCYVEACGAAPGMQESGLVQFKPSGSVVVKTGTAEIGGGHKTSYAQIVADALGVPYDDIEVVQGDTAQVPEGQGTAGSRAMPVGGSAIRESADKVKEKARRIAAAKLEAAPADLEFEDGTFRITGAPDRAVAIQEVAAAAYGGDVPEDVEPGLEATTYYDPPNYTFPFGTHVAVVEVDPQRGAVEIVRYLGVDDVGEQINPKLVQGQIHGGVVQGLGQALQEEAVYDDNGNLITASLQDYAIPKAAHVPEIETRTTVTPCPHNPLGAKGVGEAGAIAAPPAIVNAVVDALSPFDVEHLDTPVTPERVWNAVGDGRSG